MQKHSCLSNSSSSLSSWQSSSSTSSSVATEYANDLYTGLGAWRIYTSPRLCFTSQDACTGGKGGGRRAGCVTAPLLLLLLPLEVVMSLMVVVKALCIISRCMLEHCAVCRLAATHHPCVRACETLRECRVDKSTAAAAAAAAAVAKHCPRNQR